MVGTGHIDTAHLEDMLHEPLNYLSACMQDTVTGFLLAGVGSVDLRKTTNFLVVNDSESACACRLLYGSKVQRLVPAETTVKQVEDTFKDFTQRDNIAIVLINQFVSLDCFIG
jgi:V-type H+-transporting ATPase subunit F